MPTHTGKDGKGCFAQWGSQAKYYYPCGDMKAKKAAIRKANKQGNAMMQAQDDAYTLIQCEVYKTKAAEIRANNKRFNAAVKHIKKENAERRKAMQKENAARSKAVSR